MSPRALYFRKRRRLLVRRHQCIRCPEPALKGHKHCAACLEIKKAKRPDPKPSKAQREREQRRLDAIAAAHARLLARFTVTV